MGEGFLCVLKGEQDLNRTVACVMAFQENASHTTSMWYLVLDVKESDCSVLSRKHWADGEPSVSIRPSEIVIGQCKVIAITLLDGSQNLRVNDFNCTTSSVSSALVNTKDSPVLSNFFADTELYRKQADKALEKYKKENGDFASFRVDKVKRVARVRGGERTNYYLDFSVRNCSSHHFPRHSHIFGFCRANLSCDVEDSDLETPKDIVINCEVFNLKEHTNISGVKHRLGHALHPVQVSAIHTHIVLTVTIPMATIPMAMISTTMDPVTHHPIAKVPKTTIAEAMAHHLGIQKKEVQRLFSTSTYAEVGPAKKECILT
ncbi:LOW QUALITY PROTEIN: histidine-rich glycoprotein [Pseudorca crassidens]|uniref:LOW QUALITY PROTEIN: histidine-rich glycoprotein n=1 Tax=Pseudorca crassidens TaxID=82174 RepID=UPI00352FB252